ncbi:MAG: hypothetical protein ABIS14_03080 [Sphingomonas sp.]
MFVLAMLIAASSFATTPGKNPLKPICRNPEARLAKGGDKPGAHPLAAEPPAKHLYAVARSIDGCNRPVVINDTVGAKRR